MQPPEDVVSAAWQDHTTLAVLPFDQLEPRLAVFAVDGQNPIENSSHYTPTEYPLIANVYAEVAEGGAVEHGACAQGTWCAAAGQPAAGTPDRRRDDGRHGHVPPDGSTDGSLWVGVAG